MRNKTKRVTNAQLLRRVEQLEKEVLRLKSLAVHEILTQVRPVDRPTTHGDWVCENPIHLPIEATM